MLDTINLDAELRQYIETALWSTNADHLDPEDTGAAGAMDDHFSADDMAPEAVASMRADLAEFIEGTDQAAIEFWVSELGEGQLGRDFWLTRNGHGAGFWDRFGAGLGYEFGRRLTEDCKPYGSSDVYAGDDGKVYVS